MALRDFLAGPEALFPSLPVVLGQVRATRAEYDDGRPLDSATQVPPSSLDALAAQAFPVPPTTKPAILTTLARSLVRNLRTPDPAHHEVPQRNVSSRQAQWFVLSQVDSATVRPRTAAASPSAAATRSCSGPSSRPRRSCWARRLGSGPPCAAATARRPRT